MTSAGESIRSSATRRYQRDRPSRPTPGDAAHRHRAARRRAPRARQGADGPAIGPPPRHSPGAFLRAGLRIVPPRHQRSTARGASARTSPTFSSSTRMMRTRRCRESRLLRAGWEGRVRRTGGLTPLQNRHPQPHPPRKRHCLDRTPTNRTPPPHGPPASAGDRTRRRPDTACRSGNRRGVRPGLRLHGQPRHMAAYPQDRDGPGGRGGVAPGRRPADDDKDAKEHGFLPARAPSPRHRQLEGRVPRGQLRRRLVDRLGPNWAPAATRTTARSCAAPGPSARTCSPCSGSTVSRGVGQPRDLPQRARPGVLRTHRRGCAAGSGRPGTHSLGRAA